MAAMKRNQGLYVDVRHATSISHHEGLVPDPGPQAAQTAAGQSVDSGIDDRDFPIGSCGIDDLLASTLQVDLQVAVVEHEIRKIFFNDFGFITTGDKEIFVSMGRINVHDVP